MSDPLLALNADELLTTTRTVRKRLDFSRPVGRELICDCLDVALQAPNGSNMNSWQWLVVDDTDTIKAIAATYNRGLDIFVESLGDAVGESYMGAAIPGAEKISESTQYLRDNIHRSPAVLIPLMGSRCEGLDAFYQASQWGSIIQAVWSFMLALRARGLGSAWTTGHLQAEQEMAELLDIPYDTYTQVGLFPIAYTLGTDFKKAYRKPLSEVCSWNRYGERLG